MLKALNIIVLILIILIGAVILAGFALSTAFVRSVDRHNETHVPFTEALDYVRQEIIIANQQGLALPDIAPSEASEVTRAYEGSANETGAENSSTLAHVVVQLEDESYRLWGVSFTDGMVISITSEVYYPPVINREWTQRGEAIVGIQHGEVAYRDGDRWTFTSQANIQYRAIVVAAELPEGYAQSENPIPRLNPHIRFPQLIQGGHFSYRVSDELEGDEYTDVAEWYFEQDQTHLIEVIGGRHDAGAYTLTIEIVGERESD